MAIVKEFREFIARGNVIDLAVGVIIGAAFGNIVKSFTDDLVMPVIGRVMGGTNGALNFNEYYIPLDGKFGVYASLLEAKAKTQVLAYGSFVTIVIQFLLVAACVFALVKVVNKIKRTEPPPPAAPAAPTPSEVLLTEIRDLLKKEKL